MEIGQAGQGTAIAQLVTPLHSADGWHGMKYVWKTVNAVDRYGADWPMDGTA